MNSFDDLSSAVYRSVSNGNLARAERELLEYSGSDATIHATAKQWGKGELIVRTDCARLWNNLAVRFIAQAASIAEQSDQSGYKQAIDSAERCCRMALKLVVGGSDEPEKIMFFPSYLDSSVLIRSLYFLGYVSLVQDRNSFAARCLQVCVKLPAPGFPDPEGAKLQRQAHDLYQSLSR